MQEDETHGLLVAPAPGAGDARDRDGEVRSQALARAGGHGRRGLGRDRAISFQDLPWNPELAGLDLVRVGHHGADEDLAGAWDRCESLGDHAARARLRRPEGQPTAAAQIEDERLDRALVPTEEVALEWSHESLRQLVGAGFCS